MRVTSTLRVALLHQRVRPATTSMVGLGNLSTTHSYGNKGPDKAMAACELSVISVTICTTQFM